MSRKLTKQPTKYIAVDPTKLRKARPGDLNASKVAEGAGISRQQLWNYENLDGRRKGKVRYVPEPVLDYLCNRYGVERARVEAGAA